MDRDAAYRRGVNDGRIVEHERIRQLAVQHNAMTRTKIDGRPAQSIPFADLLDENRPYDGCRCYAVPAPGQSGTGG